MMREYIAHGLIHWEHSGATPCGDRRLTDYDRAVLRVLGVPEPRRTGPFATWCPECQRVRDLFFKYLRNGGFWRGPWDIQPSEERVS